MNKGSYKIWLAIVLVFFQNACTDEYTICTQPRAVDCSIDFYSQMGSNFALAPAASLSARYISNNQVFYSGNSNVGISFFKLEPGFNQVKLELQLNATSPKDTITINYSNQKQDLGLDCGIIDTHNITAISSTSNYIDSVKVIDPLVNNRIGVSNLRLFY